MNQNPVNLQFDNIDIVPDEFQSFWIGYTFRIVFWLNSLSLFRNPSIKKVKVLYKFSRWLSTISNYVKKIVISRKIWITELEIKKKLQIWHFNLLFTPKLKAELHKAS